MLQDLPWTNTRHRKCAWKAFRDLCSHRGIDFHQCQREIIASRVRAQQLDTQEKSRIRADLLTYLRETIDDRPDTPALDTARTAVFSISLTSSFVESLFSKMEYNQSKVRSRMSASTMSSVLHVHDAHLPDPRNPLDGTICLKTCASSKGEEEKARKWIGTKVCRIFDTPDGPRRFHGVVLRIEFHDIHGRWMYRVRYEDGDECDYWRYELGEVLCRCEDNI